jgi:Protein of unknown function (DUF3574)
MPVINSRIIRYKSLNSFIIAGLLLITPACVNKLVNAQDSQIPINNSITRDELYFGLSEPGGKIISELEWQKFVNEILTPRFKEGLTVMDAYGQYLNRDGKVTKEKTKLVILIYENSSARNSQIQEVIAIYKQKFHQESVLRATSNVKLSF